MSECFMNPQYVATWIAAAGGAFIVIAIAAGIVLPIAFAVGEKLARRIFS